MAPCHGRGHEHHPLTEEETESQRGRGITVLSGLVSIEAGIQALPLGTPCTQGAAPDPHTHGQKLISPEQNDSQFFWVLKNSVFLPALWPGGSGWRDRM